MLTVGDAFAFGGRVQPGAAPRIFGAFDDEGAGCAVEGIGVDLEKAVFVLAKDEGEGVEHLISTQPDVSGVGGYERRLEDVRESGANEAVDAVSGDEEVGPRKYTRLCWVSDIGVEAEGDAKLAAAPLENGEKLLAGEAGEDMAAAANELTADVGVYGVPRDEVVGDGCVGFVVGFAEGGERAVGEDDAPAIRGVGSVTLDEDDVVGGVGLLEQ